MATAILHEYPSKREGLIYRIRYDYVHPDTGKRVRPWQTLDPGTTRKQADVAMRAGLSALDVGNAPVAADRTVGSLLTEWLEQDIQGKKAETTVAGYEDTVRVHLRPAFDALALRKLTTVRMQRWETDYRATHGYRTVQLCHTRLRQACGFGVRMGYLARNPLDDVRPPATEAKPRRTWTGEQAKLFLQSAEHCTYYPLWHFLLGTGCRRGEALGLRWQDIDWDAGTARIVQTIRPLRGKTHTKVPKNPQSARVVPLHKGLIARLKAYRVKQGRHQLRMGDAYQDQGLVFASGAGTPINPNNVTRAFHLLLDQVDVPRITVHNLRHSAGTLALEHGATLEEIRQLLGHKKISTTADIYVQVKERAMRNVADSLRRAMGD
jgi:integrase